jgi:hypothetical protein
MDCANARDIITMYLVMITTLVLICHMISLDLVCASFLQNPDVSYPWECWMSLVLTEYLATQQFSLGYPLYMKSTVSDHLAQCLTCVVTYEDLCSFYQCFVVCGVMTILVLSARILSTTPVIVLWESFLYFAVECLV